MKKSQIIATTYIVIIQRFCLVDGKFDCEEERTSEKAFGAYFTCKEDQGGFPQMIIIDYKGNKDELMDKHALGKYRFVAMTKEKESPVYVQEDEAHDHPEAPRGRSFIFRDWKDEKWIGTRGDLRDDKRTKDENMWLKSNCKEDDISKCNADDFQIQTKDPQTSKKAWKEKSVSISLTDGVGTAGIIGIVAGVVVLIAIIAIVVVLVLKKKRTNKKTPKHTLGDTV